MSTQFQGGINCASSQVHFARSALCTVNYDLYALVFYLYVDDEVFLPVSAGQSFLIKNLFSLLLAGIKSTRCQGNHNFVLYLEHKNQNFTLESGKKHFLHRFAMPLEQKEVFFLCSVRLSEHFIALVCSLLGLSNFKMLRVVSPSGQTLIPHSPSVIPSPTIFRQKLHSGAQ